MNNITYNNNNRNNMSTRRPRDYRRVARIEAFLQTKCLFAMMTRRPSSRLPCCRQFAHENCLQESFNHARARFSTGASSSPVYRPSCPVIVVDNWSCQTGMKTILMCQRDSFNFPFEPPVAPQRTLV